MGVAEIIRLVEAVERIEGEQRKQEDTGRPAPASDFYMVEGLKVSGSTLLYEKSFPSPVVVAEAVVVSDKPLEFYVEVDGYRYGGDWDYWRRISSYVSTFDAFTSPEGSYVYRLAGLPVKSSVKLQAVGSATVQLLLVKVVSDGSD